ncbi:MAG TPA: MBL fold metallo-hydrolase [Methanospirillum sp.]|uniref:MBL fold metallo-hydrolase n=1 Tax=Methanospirillum sp. TaxID=45200 RepID=UPI002B7F8250|nr:MBL fold metallo-hydrolase [Methanospirillum sp.]HWQ63517.1 MBL fold metallo-hydrolase [Methanospirillum sp.]
MGDRWFLLLTLLLVLGVSCVIVIAEEATAASVLTGTDSNSYHTKIVLLGTTGGVSWYPETRSASSSSAVVVGDTMYLIDMGQGSAAHLSEAFNTGDFVNTPTGRVENGSSTFLSHARALFFTHLHQDHTADYPSLLLIGPGAGLGTTIDQKTGETKISPLLVFGPGNRGELDTDKTNYTERGGTILYTDTSDPKDVTPTPGLRQMTHIIWQAFAQSINDMTLDDGYRDFTKLITVKEIGGSEADDIHLPVAISDPNNGTCPSMDPFEVYSDKNVNVTATLVDHHQVYPALAYRFDTSDGSIVFSGDTGPDTNGNLQKLASGADVLVHEVIDPAWIDLKFGDPKPGSQMAALKEHMLSSHTSIDKVGSVAESCRVKTLVLNHIVPGNTPEEHLEKVKENTTVKVIIGEDLMQIGVGRPV